MVIKSVENDSWSSAVTADRKLNGDWRNGVIGFSEDTVEFSKGVGDTAYSLLGFPHDVLQYVSGTTRYMGERRDWSDFGRFLSWGDNPAGRAINTANSLVYGGIDLILGHMPYLLFNEKLGLNIPYFSPPPSGPRELGQELSMAAFMGAMPTLKGAAYKAFGIEAKAKPVYEHDVPKRTLQQPIPAGALGIVPPQILSFGQMASLPKKGFNGFLDFYQRMGVKHKYATNVATAATAYVGGDIIAQLILSSRNPFDVTNIITLSALSFYYGWETPLTLAKLDSAIPIKNLDIRPRLRLAGEDIKTAIAGRNVEKHLRSAFAEVSQALKDKKGEILRPLAYMGGISPFWTMRHMALLNLMHMIYAKPTTIVAGALATWASTTPIIYGLEYVIQNKIPLKYRFLAQAAVITSWHTTASLATLLGAE